MDFFSNHILNVVTAGVFSAVLKFYTDYIKEKRAEKRVVEAEDRLLQTTAGPPSTVRTALQGKEETQEPLSNSDENPAKQMANLFQLYNSQLEKYQTQTQARAGWSFIFAIFAMVSGLGLVVWGGTQALQAQGEHATAGALVSAVGGAMSAYITKTFLDVHKLSITQLNHYFKQPVLNSHILMAQRLADQLPSSDARQKAYEEIIAKVAGLIVREGTPDLNVSDSPLESGPRPRKNIRSRKANAPTDPV